NLVTLHVRLPSSASRCRSFQAVFGVGGDPTLSGDPLEAPSRSIVSRRDAGDPFPMAHRNIDVEGIEFDQPCDSAGAFRGQKGGAAAAEWIKDEALALAAVANQIGNERHWLDRRMQRHVTLASWMKAVDARIVEHVCPVPALGAKPEIVDMRCGAVLEDGDQLVLGAIKAALTRIVLVPNQQVLPFRIQSRRGLEQLLQMSPVHEDV